MSASDHSPQLGHHEAWYRAIFDQAPVAMMVLRGRTLSDLRIDVVNARAMEMLGGQASPGRSMQDVVPSMSAAFVSGVRHVLTTGESLSVDRVHQPQDRDGDGVAEDYWFNARVRAVRGSDDVIDGVVVVAVDITDMMRALQESEALAARLGESESNARLLFRDAPVPMWVHERETLRILDCNAAALEKYGYTRDEFLALTLRDLRPPEELPHLYHVLATVPATSDVRHLSTRHITRDGRILRVDLSTQPVMYNGAMARIALAQDMTAEREATDALKASETRYMLAARATNHAIWDWDIARDRLQWSEGLTRIFGYPVVGPMNDVAHWLATVHVDDRVRVAEGLDAVRASSDRASWEDSYRFLRADGMWVDVLDRCYVDRDDTGRAIRMIGAMEDVTAERQLEARLRQAQKMEAIGQLAGGIAHDFNNLLTVISGNLEFARGDLPTEHPVAPDLDEIAAATERARTLVRQLLTFSRQQPVQPRVVQVDEVVRGMERLLRRVIGEEIVFEVHVEPGSAPVLIDPGQLEQVLMNLVVNARDSLLTARHGHAGTGGSLTVEVTPRALTMLERGTWGELSAGRYVQLSVRDTGHGMDRHTQAHLYEPFFTTKDVGTGTGLGLATVHGIVQHAGGGIRVDSAPGLGTTFTILLPAVDTTAAPLAPVTAPAAAPEATATILVVEDETPVRTIVRRTLERQGYQVLEARHGADALLLWRRHRERVDAVITDMRMPEMGGEELVKQLRAERADLPVVFVSGYAEESSAALVRRGDRFVEKPFTTDVLLSALADVLRAQHRSGD